MQHGLHYRRQLEPALRVQHRGVPNLHVADVLQVRVFGEFERDPLQRKFVLHHPQGDVEALEIILQRGAALPRVERPLETVPTASRKPNTLLLGQLEQGAKPKRPVQVGVQIGLR